MSLAALVASYATVYRTIGLVIAVVIAVGVIVYAAINVIFLGKPEVGSEIELAPNRKPYYSDEELEGPKLDRALTWGLLTLFVIGIGLPLYWIMEPGRQANAASGFNDTFIERGREMFAPVGDNLAALGCAGCHGGMKAEGGSAPYTLLKPDGSFDKVVTWKAPALNTVLLRYSRDEVTYVLTYGRPFSPMPAWGLLGNGPLNDQQIQNLVDYLESIQISPEESQKQAQQELDKMMALKNADGTPVYASEGEALFNMGIDDGFAGGAYACGRCHTQGWSYASSIDELKAPGCGSALGPNLCDGDPLRQFPADLKPPEGQSPFQSHIDFVTEGSVQGQKYGVQGQGTGRMPGFGEDPAETALFYINKGLDRPAGPGMMSQELIEQIVAYERTL
jgi:cytochrome c553